jgi:iron complex outermembrane receptor protein
MRATNRRRAIRAMLGSAAIGATAPLLAISQAYAQTAAEAGSPEQGAQALPNSERDAAEITVTAQRRSERLRDVPISVTAQSAEDLARQGVTSIQDLTIAVPGLSVTKLGPWVQPTVRGVQTSIAVGGADAPVAIYLDGAYRPNQVANLFDLPDVKQIEVLKGPQGTLFGRNATGGAILIHTLEPSLDGMTGKISVSDGVYFGEHARTANEITVKGFVSAPISDTLAISTSGYFSHNPGFMTHDVAGDRYGRRQTFMARGKLLFQPSDTVKFLLSGMYTKTNDADSATFFPLGGLAVGREYPGAIVPDEPWHFASELSKGSTIRMTDWNVSLKGEIEIGQAGTLTSITAYSEANPLLIVDADGTYSPACVAVVACVTPFVVEYGPQKTFQQELTFASRQFGMFSFITGLFYYDDKHASRNNVNSPIRSDGTVNPDVDGVFAVRSTIATKAYAAFGEVNLDLSDKLHLIAGMRYSWERKIGTGGFFQAPKNEFSRGTWNSWTPRLSVLYNLNPDVNLYATYSKGFKSGILDSSALAPTPVRPETLTSYEIGIKAANSRFSVSAAAFYYDYKDVQLQFRRAVVNFYANAEGAKVYGIDLDATVHLTDSLDLRVGGAWLPRARYREFKDGRAFDLPMTPRGLTSYVVDATGKRMLRSPKLTATATLAYSGEISWGHLDASTTLYYSGTYYHDLLYKVPTKSYATLSARVALTPTGSPLTFAIFATNLTNKVYVDGSVLSQYANNVHFGNPRQVGLSVDFAF